MFLKIETGLRTKPTHTGNIGLNNMAGEVVYLILSF